MWKYKDVNWVFKPPYQDLILPVQLKQRYRKHVFPPSSTVEIITVLAVQNGGLWCWRSAVVNGEKGQGRSWFACFQMVLHQQAYHQVAVTVVWVHLAPPCSRLLQADLPYCSLAELLLACLSYKYWEVKALYWLLMGKVCFADRHHCMFCEPPRVKRGSVMWEWAGANWLGLKVHIMHARPRLSKFS